MINGGYLVPPKFLEAIMRKQEQTINFTWFSAWKRSIIDKRVKWLIDHGRVIEALALIKVRPE